LSQGSLTERDLYHRAHSSSGSGGGADVEEGGAPWQWLDAMEEGSYGDAEVVAVRHPTAVLVPWGSDPN
jgi:hypothetical protein